MALLAPAKPPYLYADFVGLAYPAQQLGIDVLGLGDFQVEMPAVLGNLLCLRDPGTPNRLVGLDGEQQVLLSGMYAEECRPADEMDRCSFDLFLIRPDGAERGR